MDFKDLSKILTLLVISLFLIGYIIERKNKLKINKRNMFIFLIIVTVIILTAIINISMNGGCKLNKSFSNSLKELPQIKCNIICYCDGLGNDKICIGKYRGLCAV